ncbi:uncharacterized protein LOC62_04G005609 [Vanrija pseudolonga]|uniref:RRN7-type domain-containing protein n=1 Tax=Vanrija pseudolonga TaxID=143232 RepID=A0AAF1BIY6_9TREE|nr:hypothetical protein LOC62_04G005609 [Vanrija pseudolonga]
MAKKCPTCGSRKWRKDGITGSVVCEEGHVLQDVRSENLVAEMTGHALQKRRMKTGLRINKRKMEGTRDKNYVHGVEAESLRIQGLQLLLRHQVAALRQLWALPEAFELVVRDLWTYQLLVSPLPSLQPPPSRPASPAPVPESGPSRLSGELRRQLSDSDTESDSGSATSKHEKEDGDTDSSKEDEVSDKSDEEEDEPLREVDVNGPPPAEIYRRKRKLRVSDTLACLLLGLWILRIPFTHAGIESLINLNRIPYIDFGKSTLLPEEMRMRMNHDVRVSLRPPRSPTPIAMFEFSRKFASILVQRFGLAIPEINVPPVAWEVLSALGGTAVTQSQVVSFLELIDANMSLSPAAVTRTLRKRRNSDPDPIEVDMPAHAHDVIMPELSIAAAWVIVMKLAYGLDGKERFALMKTEPLIGQPRGDLWVEELRSRLDSRAFQGTRTDLERLYFDGMDENDLDRFLDRCEDVLLKDRDHGAPGPFPLPTAPRSTPRPPVNESWDSFHSLAARKIVTLDTVPSLAGATKDLPLMPGEKLKSYDPADVTGTLPRDYEVVLNSAAQVVGVESETLAEVVQVYERKMDRQRPRREFFDPAVQRRVVSSGLRESRSFG